MATIAWQPDPARVARARVSDFIRWLAKHRDLRFANYDELWRWSVEDLDAFWQAVAAYFALPFEGDVVPALTNNSMPDARWFPGVRTNYVAQIFRMASDQRPAIVFRNEAGLKDEVSWSRLEEEVAALAGWLRRQGVGVGDRVAGFLPNIPQAVVAFLACASIGAIWSMCSAEMGESAVADRFRQIEPKVLIAVDGYRWGGKAHSRREVLERLLQVLPSVEKLVLVPYLHASPATGVMNGSVPWETALAEPAALQIENVPFSHPLWIVYSSGTTGLPKPIVHGHGGILIEHVKSLALHNDVLEGDRFHWFSTTGWVTWNINVSALLLGATLCIYDGNPAWPDYSTLWRFCEEVGLDFFGASAAYFAMCEKSGVVPREYGKFTHLRTIGSTGSPLSAASYSWIYREISPDIWLAPMSGGTDIAGCFVGGIPIQPVVAGEMQVRCLGAHVQSWNTDGKEVVDDVGELVCVAPLPSMPLRFWNDPGDVRLKDSYFSTFPGVWRHGDWLRLTPRGGVIIYGRSDATINRHGVRMGTSELYSAVEAMPEVVDSLVVDIEYLGRESYMPLFVVLKPGNTLDDRLRDCICSEVRTKLSSRHVPNEVIQVDDIPRTVTGKKMEVPVKRLLLGHEPSVVANREVMANPASLDWYVSFARTKTVA